MRLGFLFLMAALSVGFIIFFMQSVELFKGNNWVFKGYFVLIIFSFCYHLIITLRDKDIEIIRHSEQTFDLNGERLLLDKNTDSLEVLESSGRGGSFYSIKLHYGDRKVELCYGLREKDYDAYMPQITSFLGLPVTKGRPWYAKIFG
ncbi:MAG: hypothetical protein JO154_21080 [Chitinophaga sp.]|uniref:hypothetical protein n=1 Tax=Chitinophaga sp. TaxID=1869181 RepID=UPI0025BD8767|nr:hypothetical protein [Chitinophaga sp.]MBV8255109.1 hypothetical protein [Chitinophaga sp.]